MSQMNESITLHNTENGSDKLYVVELVQCDGGWLLNYQNGKRGGTLKGGTKTDVPVPYEVAKKEFDKLVASKIKGKYVPLGDVVDAGIQHVVKSNETIDGHLPKLPSSITLAECENLIKDDRYGAQIKADGERRQASNLSGQVIGTNCNGLQVPLPLGVVDAMEFNPCSAHLDGEAISIKLFAFDTLNIDGVDLRGLPFVVRHKRLTEYLPNNCDVVLVPLAKTEHEKRVLFEQVKARNGEGLVFTLLDSTYESGRSTTTHFKFKFVEDATVRVMSVHPTKRSVGIGAIKDGEYVDVGNVTIPANKDIPDVGDFIDVQYLYYFKGGSLFQPVIKKREGTGRSCLRNDKNCADDVDSLKVKPDSEAVFEIYADKSKVDEVLSDPSNAGLKPFMVLVNDQHDMFSEWFFHCLAEDVLHAKEQACNAQLIVKAAFDELITEDGYKFSVLPCGMLGDGDMKLSMGDLHGKVGFEYVNLLSEVAA